MTRWLVIRREPKRQTEWSERVMSVCKTKDEAQRLVNNHFLAESRVGATYRIEPWTKSGGSK